MLYKLNEKQLEQQLVLDCEELEKHILLAEKRELDFVKDTRQLKVEASEFASKHAKKTASVS